MPKSIWLGLTTLSLIFVSSISKNEFQRYKKIEAYEVRPGILMLPRYAADHVCEIGLQGLHYSPELIRLEPRLTRKEVDQIIDELVPKTEKGKPIEGAGRPLIEQVGNSLVTTLEFENISVGIYSAVSQSARKDETKVNEVVATIKWKNQTCH
jgi:hypothetical protein